MTIILDGRKLNAEIVARLARQIKRLKHKPKLVIVQVGSVPESDKYIKRKKIFGEKIGAIVEHKKYPGNVLEQRLISEISKFNKSSSVHGIIVQLPLPKHLQNILGLIAEEKRVDGGKYFRPATAKGVLALLDKYRIKITGKKAVVVGRSELVGKPIALALLEREATVTICHKQTKDLKRETKQAEILVVAAGSPELITKNHVSRDQIVIDVGINILGNEKLVGDVDFKNVSKKVRAISPVPGGVGPMTVASLFQNLLEAYELQT
ncbi:MAG: hypothetical protein A3J09_02555 [Candidatus Zambryskibacteria bacterium RIFCSPLOWO2_02_FULL_51_21]|uniref:Bifunctional protein FolD n=1 Tax=Candidatus Zambryskibacteria bacterium RIFCSPHIGHO2_02_FULL_43_37 TaxID=1802749 RepID=A0A1G2THR0_9BACT|nr:MAG: hypothetical protein A2723_02545 [Candidatus Zambryskibacteria bacterium RIFCSPHIGHO2_01_FULL_52_18]OHA96598.1 MAG: hypothetical protein A3D49_00345 [Candidatus Zambryskibacteria bacterium RIFCSPHIGHO2_02_FULL_43_37]OHB07807.1 MAG: hypothetical protein A2944_00220 [Candidatus Zambryskibacteria bacterium RIFCSPLOWO2_01_FULL_52_12]OHB11409.1 MAG: hypothetical protein A3J09_02555 [Candidatus Zambryskibacteria bacterium RIFCSPLOWO2_02_FULL_51_21]